MSFYKAAWCCLAGSAHGKRGVPCQDRIAFFRGERAAAMALADGAGSKRNSQLGAQLAANGCAELLCSNFDSLFSLDGDALRGTVLRAILDSMKVSAYPLEELSSTLIFSAVSEDRFLCGHIGDGVLVRYTGEPEVLSHPENGEFRNETYFLTDSDAEEHFHIYKGTGETGDGGAGFMLMSDGAASSLYHAARGTLSPVCGQFFGWLAQEKEDRVSQAIEENMKTYFVRKSVDDLSLGMIMVCK